eukprot:scaffold1139_cov31-Attheya_sp.AAC.1
MDDMDVPSITGDASKRSESTPRHAAAIKTIDTSRVRTVCANDESSLSLLLVLISNNLKLGRAVLTVA